MTQSGFPPTPDPASPEGADPYASTSPLGAPADWYTAWTPDAAAASPVPAPPGTPPTPAPYGMPPAAAGPAASAAGTPEPYQPAGYGPVAYGPPPPAAYGPPPFGPAASGQQPGYARAGQVPMRLFLRRRAMRIIGTGALLLIVGIVITAATYGAASSSPNGGVYFVPWGLVLVGALWIFRGVGLLMRSSRVP